jgi:hypothetical protein
MSPEKFGEIAENIEELANAWIAYVKTQKHAGSLKLAPAWKCSVSQAYEARFKSEFKVASCDDSKGFLDRHKIAAAMAQAVMSSQPLISGFGEKGSLTVRDANSLLALETGGVIIFGFGLAEAKLTGNSDLERIYDPAVGFDFPTPGNGNQTYIEHFSNTLRQINQKIQPFMLSHVFFLLQRHFETYRALTLGVSSATIDPFKRREAIQPYLATIH